MEGWRQLHSTLSGASVITIPRGYLFCQPESARLVGFSDTSTKAYATVVCLRLEPDTNVYVRFVAAKTHVAPLKGMTIPRIELLSALLLAKLIVSVHTALQAELTLHSEPVCYIDSKISFYWIQGTNPEWRQFVENCVVSTRSLVLSQNWKHCPGVSNFADIPFRGMLPSELSENQLWLNGPEWLATSSYLSDSPVGIDDDLPEECYSKLKRHTATQLFTSNDHINRPHSSKSSIVRTSTHLITSFM